METPSGEIINLEGICGDNVVTQEQENINSSYEGTMTTFQFGDVVNGIQIISPTEEVYSNGIRRIYAPDTGRSMYIRPDGSEVVPGEEVEMPGGSVLVVPSVEEEIYSLEAELQNDELWNRRSSRDGEAFTSELREAMESQLENLRRLVE